MSALSTLLGGGNSLSQLGQYAQPPNFLQQQLHRCQHCGAHSLGYHDCGQFPQAYTTTRPGITMSYSGSKPLVVCNGTVTECKDLDEAQSKAEQLAHQHQADAFILRPVKKVAPKREVVTTDIP